MTDTNDVPEIDVQLWLWFLSMVALLSLVWYLDVSDGNIIFLASLCLTLAVTAIPRIVKYFRSRRSVDS